MTDNRDAALGKNPERGRRRTRVGLKLAYAGASVCLLLAAILLTIVAVCLTRGRGLGRFVEFGLVQPTLAALFALIVVLGIWVTKGRYVGERRKGVSSASSSTIAIRLWALCFVLLFSAMLLSALLASWQRHSIIWRGAPKSEEKIEIKSETTATGNSNSIKVTR